MRPIPAPHPPRRPTATNALPTISRPRTPSSTPPTYVSSSSTRPASRSRPGRTMARRTHGRGGTCAARSRRLHSYPNPRPAATPGALAPPFWLVTHQAARNHKRQRLAGVPENIVACSYRAPANRRRRRPAGSVCWSMPTGPHTAGIRSRRASAASAGTHGRPARSRIELPTRQGLGVILLHASHHNMLCLLESTKYPISIDPIFPRRRETTRPVHWPRATVRFGSCDARGGLPNEEVGRRE